MSETTGFLTSSGYNRLSLKGENRRGEKVRLYHLGKTDQVTVDVAKVAIRKEIEVKNRQFDSLGSFEKDVQTSPYLLKEGAVLRLLRREEAEEIERKYQGFSSSLSSVSLFDRSEANQDNNEDKQDCLCSNQGEVRLDRIDLARLLIGSNEELREQASRDLFVTFDISTLSGDIDSDNLQLFVCLEKKVYLAIRQSIILHQASGYTFSLLYNYENILERIFLISLLETDLDHDAKKSILEHSENLSVNFKPYIRTSLRLEYLLGSIDQIANSINMSFIQYNTACGGLDVLGQLQCSLNRAHYNFFCFFIGCFYDQQGNVSRSTVYFEKAKNLWDTVEQREVAEFYCVGSRIFLFQGYKGLKEHKKLIELLEEILSIGLDDFRKKLAKTPFAVPDITDEDILFTLIGLYESGNDRDRVNRCIQQLVDNASEGVSKDSSWLTEGDNLHEQGEPNKAVHCLEISRKIAEKSKNNKAFVQASGELANIYLSNEQYEKAAELYREGLNISKKDRGLVNYQVKCLLGMASAYSYLLREEEKISHWGEVEKCLREYYKIVGLTEPITSESFDKLGLEESVQIGQILLRSGQYSETRDLLLHILFNYNQGKYTQRMSEKEEATLYQSLGIAFLHLKEFSSSVYYFEKAIKTISDPGKNSKVLEAILGSLGLAYLRQNLFDEAIPPLERAITFYEAEEKKYSNYEMQIFNLESGAKLYLNLEEALLSRGNNAEIEALRISENSRSRSLAKIIESKVKRKSSSFQENSFESEVLSIAKNLKTTLVIYSFSLIYNDRQAFVWIISPDGRVNHRKVSIASISEDVKGFDDLLKNFPFSQGRGDSNLLELSSIQEFTEAMRGKPSREERKKQLKKEIEEKAPKIMDEAREKFAEKLSGWYQALIAPIEKFLPADPSHTVTIIPDSFLAQLPFAAMKDKDGNYFIEKHSISLAPSIRVLQLLEALASERKGRPNKQALIIGNPIPDDPNIKQLEIGESEAKDVGALLRANPENVLLQKEATVSHFMEKASEAQWIFAACHGEANEKPEQDPHSVFEGQLKLTPDEKYKNGNLHSQLVSSLELKAELVFLSTCYSGTGKEQQEGVIGNVWSFLAAGALSTVATYWRLPETETTRKMVNCFYQHILGEGDARLNKAQALREAMLLGMQDGKDKFEQWGAFYLSGCL